MDQSEAHTKATGIQNKAQTISIRGESERKCSLVVISDTRIHKGKKEHTSSKCHNKTRGTESTNHRRNNERRRS